jgi:hypothetical protein
MSGIPTFGYGTFMYLTFRGGILEKGVTLGTTFEADFRGQRFGGFSEKNPIKD